VLVGFRLSDAAWGYKRDVMTSLQVFGGYGYLKEYKVERVWRDLRVHRLLEGTNEVMNIIIARELAKQ